MKRTEAGWVGAVVVFALACGTPPTAATGHESERPAEPPLRDGSANVAFDPAAVVRRIQLGFRAEGAVFTSEHTTHAVVVDDVAIHVRPRHTPARTRAVPHAARDGADAQLVGAPLQLATRSLRRGGELARGANANIDRQGRLVRASADYAERLENTRDGVELSWSFERAPRGGGDLVVRVAASGLEHAGETDGGIHFRDPVTMLGLRFGHATWVDARGDRTPIRVRYDQSDLIVRVPSALLDTSAYPAVLDPVIGPEVAVDVPVSGPSTGSQEDVSVAYDGSGYMVVWRDSRAQSSGEIVATRVSAAGAVLDSPGIIVASSYSSSHAVVFDGTHYFVVWAHGLVVAQRFSTAGVPVGSQITLATNGVSVSAAAQGSTVFVTFAQGNEIAGVRVTDGSVVDTTPIVLAASSSQSRSDVRTTVGGGTWLTSWQQHNGTDNDVYLARVSTDGTPLDASAPISVAAGAVDQWMPWPASNGTNFLVAWYEGGSIKARIFNGATGGSVIHVATIASWFSCAFIAGNYEVVWANGTTMYANRVTSAGTVLDGASGLSLGNVSNESSRPRIVSAAGGGYVVWTGYHATDGMHYDPFGSRLSAANVLLDLPGVLLATASNGQRTVQIASDGTNALAVWKDDRGGVTGIYGARVSGTTGSPIDSSAILLSPGGLMESDPVVAWNGTQWLVAWRDERSPYAIRGTRVSTAGAVVDPGGLVLVSSGTVARPSNRYDLASNGSGWYLVWSDARAGSSDIYGARISAAGANLDGAGVAISTAAGSESRPQVAFGGGEYLVAWYDYRSETALYASRVSTAGVVLDPAGIATGAVGSSISVFSLDVAHVGSNFAIAYGDGTALRVVRVSHAGSVVGTRSIGSKPEHTSMVEAGGIGHVLYENGNRAVRYTRFGSDGLDLDSSDAVLASDAASYAPVGLAALASGRTIAAYTRYDATPGVTALRVVTRTVDRNANGTSCSSALTCASGNCVDGVCCDSACGGGAAGDCQACSTSTGAAVSGSCGPVTAGVTCRAGTDACDAAETCNGTDLVCPADGLEPPTTVCRPAADACDADETCTGTTAVCPSDLLAPAGTGCRPAASECDVAETCSGIDAACPIDAAKAEGSACAGAPSGECDAQDTCAGTEGASATCVATFAPDTTSCRAASCSGGIETYAATCTGLSELCPDPITQSCGGFSCAGAVCATSCGSNTDCASGHYCNTVDACAPLGNSGDACRAPGECATGHCVDGVCCDVACTGQCEACDLEDQEGTCSPVTGAPRAARPACTSDGSVCGGTCDGSTRDGCTYPAASTACRTGSCTDGVAVVAAGCSGAGSCPALATQDCAPYVCGTSACLGDCTQDPDCATGTFCAAGACTAALANGGACGRNRECASNQCIDGVCCDSACEGQCEACDVAGREGTCSAVTGPTHGARAGCASDGSRCGGACDGMRRDACAYPSGDSSCGASMCSGGVETAAGACDGGGACTPGSVRNCAPYACGTDACLEACSTDTQCASGLHCRNTECVEASDAGASEAADGGARPNVEPVRARGGGCAVGGPRAPHTTLGLYLALAAILLVRRRRRRRSQVVERAQL